MTTYSYVTSIVTHVMELKCVTYAHALLCVHFLLKLDFSLTVKAAPHECVIKISQP